MRPVLGTTSGWHTEEDLASATDLLASLPSGCIVVPSEDPVAAMSTLRAAHRRAAIPLIAPPGWPSASVAQTVQRAEALLCTGSSVGGRPSSREPMMLVLTSGSTGAPRAVLRTLASWQESVSPFTALTGLSSERDIVWAPGGLSSTLTLFAVWHAMTAQVPVIATGRWRSVPAAGPLVATATSVHCVPGLLTEIVEAKRAGQLPLLRQAVVGGAALSPGLRRRASEAGLEVVEYYGAAELSFVAADPDGNGLRAFPGVELQIREGQVWVRSDYLANGYLGDGSAAGTGSSGPFRRDDDGWATVGDLATMVGETLLIAGRGEQGLSVGGYTVLIGDIESALGRVDGVAEVICLAEKHRVLGQRAVAAVRPEPGCDPVPAMRRTARSELPPPARPARYITCDAFPRTPGGKVDRLALARELRL